MIKYRRSKLNLLLILVVVCILLTGVWTYMSHSLRHQQIEQTLKLHISNIENDFQYAVDEVYSVQSLVVGANGTPVDLDKVGEVLRRNTLEQFISCVLLAPDGIVDQVFPLEGNEHFLGLDLYSDDSVNVGTVMETQSVGRLVISYPYTTEKGNMVILGRLPVYLPLDDGSYKTWGVASVCVAFPEILENLRTDVLTDRGYAYRIFSVEEDSGTAVELINHNFDQFRHTVSSEFTLADMPLRIEAAPEHGWFDTVKTIWFFLHVLVMVSLLGMLTELLMTQIRKLLQEAKTDELTGLLNRATGEKEINRILQAKDFQKGIFLMMDMDNFKGLNDTFGHQRGDEALAGCSHLLKSLFRKHDIICRLGGDEFVVFLPYTGSGVFMEEKIHKLLKAMDREITENEKTVHLSASIGLALAPKHGATFNQLYTNADLALYRSKALGRNCCTLFDGASVSVRENVSAVTKAPEKNYVDRRTILIVDDDFINRALIKNIFSDRFNFLEAENGVQGLAQMDAHAGELCAILVDASMPVMDGIEMLRIMNENGMTAQIPVFMITAHTESDISQEAYKYGVRDVITKPIMPVVIQRRIQTVIELFQARDMLKHMVKNSTKENSYQ